MPWRDPSEKGSRSSPNTPAVADAMLRCTCFVHLRCCHALGGRDYGDPVAWVYISKGLPADATQRSMSYGVRTLWYQLLVINAWGNDRGPRSSRNHIYH